MVNSAIGELQQAYAGSFIWVGSMLTDEQGRAKCVACGLCPQICPANCIKLVPGEDEEGHRYPLIYEIDTWVWLHELGCDLGSVPGEEWDAIAALGPF